MMQRLCTIRVLWFTGLTYILFVAGASGEALTLEEENGKVSIRISDIKYPTEITTRELKSGLKNHFVANLSVYLDQVLIDTYVESKSVHFDLWDEIFITNHKNTEGSFQKKHTDTVLLVKDISNFSFKTNIMYPPLDTQHKAAELYAVAYVVFNPVTKEKMEKIQKWISKGLISSGSSNQENGGRGSRDHQSFQAPRFGRLFNHILRKNTDSDSFAQWESEKIEKSWKF